MEDNIDIIDLLTDYLSGNAGIETIKELNDRISRSEEDRAIVKNYLGIWLASENASHKKIFDESKGYRRFLSRLNKEARASERFSNRRWLKYAAIAAVILVPFLTFSLGKKSVSDSYDDITIEAPQGSRTKMTLPDGSNVWLNAGSRITYSQGFGVEDRILRLEGEGYFEVAKNEKKPFELMTDELSLRVLGTKFNIKNYPNGSEVIVNLFEGMVAIHNEVLEMPDLILHPNEKAVLDKQTGKIIKEKAKSRTANSWVDNELHFDEEPLGEIAKDLERAYNVRIDVADSVASKRFYGIFSATEGDNVEDVLEDMASTNRIKYKLISEGVYLLY